MDFYRILSKYYDELFPIQVEEMDFVVSLLRDADPLLDAGCGTGNKTAILAEGRHAVGFDSNADMIALANERYATERLSFVRLDMREMGARFAPGSFAAVTCLGNTLAHLTGDGELREMLRQARAVLGRDGVFVVQILNYDRMLGRAATPLPVLESDRVVFIREYRRQGVGMVFHSAITEKDGGKVWENDVPIHPIPRAGLDGLLAEEGFAPAAHYGSYAGAVYAEETSFHLIIRANVENA